MSIIRSYKDDIIEDQMRTIKRLNEELSMRIKYEERLLCVIRQLEEEQKMRQFEALDRLRRNYNDVKEYDTTEEDTSAENQRGFVESMKLDESEKDK